LTPKVLASFRKEQLEPKTQNGFSAEADKKQENRNKQKTLMFIELLTMNQI